MPSLLATLAERWATAKPAERANAQSYIIELSRALEVDPPAPAGSGYEFEYAIKVVARDGTESTNFVDCYKAHHFALEAKDQEPGGSDDRLLRRAFGQLRNYVGHLPDERPPYLLVLDVGRTLMVWDRWSGDYGGYGAGRRIDLRTLAEHPEDVDLLRDIWTNPAARDPRGHAAAVTRDIARKLGELAASLESRGQSQEAAARFLIRVVFTMFAEDIDLLPEETFRSLLDDVETAELPAALEDLWRAMDTGGRFGGRRLARFNGHFFRDVSALPLTSEDHVLLIQAADHEWADVEPSIFGTLLVRALDPVERHRLGAEFTPREFVERLVRPTIEEPVRERWTLVQAEVLQLRETGKEKDRKAALRAVQRYHEWLCGLRILDPACGSGNFLYVTLHLLKRIELEVLALESELRKAGDADFRLFEVHPRQFHGIEVKPWAREIAELTLWIGYHQFWKQHRHVEYPEPVLEDTGTIECRDAVLAWAEIRHDPSRDRPDPTPRIVHPVTGELVPDPDAKLPYMEYVNPRQAGWPQADFIVGNPPYLGLARQREAFGDGYVDALRSAYAGVSDTVDFVIYWWYRAAAEVAAYRALRAGLITTKSITQPQSRSVVRNAAAAGARVVWAIPSHPWVDDLDAAAVRVAMTVIGREQMLATLIQIDDDAQLVSEVRVSRLNADLSARVDTATAASVELLANSGLSSPGFKLHGAGFIIEQNEAYRLLEADPSTAQLLRPYRNGKDLTARPRGAYIIDFGMLDEVSARRSPTLFDIVRDRVRPDRLANHRAAYRNEWWRFGEPRRELRQAIQGLARFIVTVETSKHRFFQFLDASVAPDNRLICIATDDASVLGVLSSAVHRAWALATGSRLEDRPVYVKSCCFDAFPFPAPEAGVARRIAALALRVHEHRNAALSRDERVTMTGMYNVVEKLRAGTPLTPKERAIHEIAACGVLRDLHDELDALVAEAYGWPWPMEREEVLERLVALHDERVAEEQAGTVRWLRPDYQIPRFGQDLPHAELGLAAPAPAEREPIATRPAWPRSAIEQLSAVKSLLASRALAPAEVAAAFDRADAALVARHIETLALMGELVQAPDGTYSAAS
jgi:hypothetical protein